jgi:hypothetical protein
MGAKTVARELVIIAVAAAVTVVATGGILSVRPAYAIDPTWGSCTGNACPGASGFTQGIQHKSIVLQQILLIQDILHILQMMLLLE